MGCSFTQREYPKNDNEARDYVALLQVVREGLDNLARSKNEDPRSYDLTIAAVCLRNPCFVGLYNYPLAYASAVR
jgi:GH18 family chitinase